MPDAFRSSISAGSRPSQDAAPSRWRAYARFLALFTVFYNLAEGLVSMGFGWKDDSMALLGFGADSFIEVGSALLVLWRLRAERETGSTRPLLHERRATLGIGVMFVLLALGTTLAAIWQLLAHHRPETTLPGLVVSVLSLSFMYWLWRAKQRAARALDSHTLMGDAACSRACMQLSAILFAGSLTFRLAPALWWADAMAAVILSLFIGWEGITGIRAACRPDFTGGCGCH